MEEITELTKTLIQFESVRSKPEEIERCATYIQQYLTESDIDYQRLDYNGVPSILVMPQCRRVQVLLMSHFDVVAGTRSLFTPWLRNGYLYGRGSLDDKYAVALSLVLLKNYVLEYRANGLDQDDLPLGILLTGDEEAGGENGAKKALATIKSDFCIALDGGNLNEIVTKEKGIVQIRLVSKGKSCHGARPWLGQNAIETLIKDYQEIRTLFNLTEPDNWHRTVNLASIKAGNSYNQVPETAEAVLDIRYTEHDPIDHLIQVMKRLISSELEIIRKDPLFTAKPSPYLDLLLKSNPNIKTVSEHGSSDARFLSLHGISGIVWGANGNSSHHSEQEHIDIDSIAVLYKKLDYFLRQCSDIN